MTTFDQVGKGFALYKNNELVDYFNSAFDAQESVKEAVTWHRVGRGAVCKSGADTYLVSWEG